MINNLLNQFSIINTNEEIIIVNIEDIKDIDFIKNIKLKYKNENSTLIYN